MNSKNYLIWGAVALVVILVGFYLVKGYSKPSDNSESQTVTTQTVSPTSVATGSGEVTAKAVVNYTDNGFTPNTITVKVGDSVTWTNQSSGSMWVASNPHPTHTDLPGFDELTSVDRGGTYSYTFTKVGNWGYHNHPNPSDKGVVIVQ